MTDLGTHFHPEVVEQKEMRDGKLPSEPTR